MAQKHLDDIQRNNLISYLTTDDYTFLASLLSDYAKNPPPSNTLDNETEFRKRLVVLGDMDAKINARFSKIETEEKAKFGSNPYWQSQSPVRAMAARQYVYTKLLYIDKEIKNYALLKISSGSDPLFGDYREQVKTAIQVAAVATVGYVAYTGLAAAAATSTAVATASAETALVAAESGSLAGATGLLGSSTVAAPVLSSGGIVASGAASSGILGGLGLSTAQIAGAGTLLATTAESEVKNFVQDLINPKKDEPKKDLLNVQYGVSNGFKGSVGATILLALAGVLYFII